MKLIYLSLLLLIAFLGLNYRQLYSAWAIRRESSRLEKIAMNSSDEHQNPEPSDFCRGAMKLPKLLGLPDTFNPDDRRRRQILNIILAFFIAAGLVSILATFSYDDRPAAAFIHCCCFSRIRDKHLHLRSYPA